MEEFGNGPPGEKSGQRTKIESLKEWLYHVPKNRKVGHP